jgi:hypothetical protein
MEVGSRLCRSHVLRSAVEAECEVYTAAGVVQSWSLRATSAHLELGGIENREKSAGDEEVYIGGLPSNICEACVTRFYIALYQLSTRTEKNTMHTTI